MSSKNWYAVYVKSRSEKRVALDLEMDGIEYYLPIIKVLKKWSDRRKWVEEPLFKSYMFVYIEEYEHSKVLQIRNVVKYINFEGKAAAIRPEQIEAIKYYLNEKDPENIENQTWDKGTKVEVISGSMSGLKGELINVRGKNKVKVEIDVVGQSIVIEIPKSKLILV